MNTIVERFDSIKIAEAEIDNLWEIVKIKFLG